MKRLMMAVGACVCALGAMAATTADYVQDGLVACWDGYENGGRYQHETSSTEWVDVVGGRVLTLTDGESFDGCEVTLVAGAHYTEDALFDAPGDVTIEVNGRPVSPTSPHNMVIVGIPNFAELSWDARNGGMSIKRVDSAGATQNHYISYDSGYSSASAIANSGVSQTYTALIGVNSSAVYVNGQSRAQTNGLDWKGNARSSDFRLQVGSPSSGEVIRSIRIYNRKLTADEIAANHAVDVKRFDEGDLSGWPGVFAIGEPQEYAVAGLPVYGLTKKSVGETAELNAPEGAVEVSDGVRAFCAGWKLYDGETGELVSESTDATRTRCTFTYEKSVRIVWQWKMSYRVTASADTGLSATTSSDWAWEGEEVTLTVTENGAKFVGWEGVSADGTFRKSYTFRPTGPVAAIARTASVVKYVESGASGDGSSWASPSGSLQDMLTAVKDSSDPALICVKGDFTVSSAIGVENAAGMIRIVGGCTGEGFATSGRSAFVRDTSATTRLFSFSASKVAFENLRVSDGLYKTVENSALYGQGVRLLAACTAYFRNCSFDKNGSSANVGGNTTPFYGGAIGAQKGSLIVVDCEFVGNRIADTTGTNTTPYGGAIGMNGDGDAAASVTVLSSRFAFNSGAMAHARWGGGGAIAVLNCPQVEISACLFETNFIRRAAGNSNYGSNGQSDLGPWGGTVYLRSCEAATIRDCAVVGGWNNAYAPDALYNNYGGVFFFTGSTVALVRTSLWDVGKACDTAGQAPWAPSSTYCGSWTSGGIDVRGGKLFMTNVLHAASYTGWLIGNMGGDIEAVNCTFTGALKQGAVSRPQAVYVQHSAGTKPVTFRNCIFWNNAFDLYNCAAGDAPVFTNCSTTEDPGFADDKYCHPKSIAGSYHGGWFSGGTWTADDATSVMVDYLPDAAGDEPQPNGRALNLGYDGGSPVASKTACGADPFVTDDKLMVFAYKATDISAEGDGSAVVKGEVASTGGGANPVLTVVWDVADRGISSADNWAHSHSFGARAPWDLVSYTIDELDGKTCYYRFLVTNEKGTAWSDPLQSFTIGKKATGEYATPAVQPLYHDRARIVATVTDDGGMEATAQVVYAPADDPSDVHTAVFDRGAAVTTGDSVSVELTGLQPGTAYVAHLELVNGMGTTALADVNFTALAVDEPISLCVGETATGAKDGSSWANAVDFATALKLATGLRDEVKLLAGTVTVERALSLQDFSGLILRGGYTGEGDAREGRTTFLRPADATSEYRIIEVARSTVTFDRIGVENGCVSGDGYGFGVQLLGGCHATFTNCYFAKNGNVVNKSGYSPVYGGAIGAQNGELTVVDCTFNDNTIHCNDDGSNTTPYGAAVGATGAKVVIRGCAFGTNWVQMVHARSGGGGAVACVNCTSVEIADCDFEANYARRGTGEGNYTDGQTGYGPYGGAILVQGTADAQTPVIIRDCRLSKNWSNCDAHSTYPYWCWGGSVYLWNCQSAVTRTVLTDNGHTPYTKGSSFTYANGGLDIRGGTLALTNVLIGSAYSCWCLGNQDGAVEAVNCTFAGALGTGKGRAAAGYVEHVTSASAAVSAVFRNCIFWNNKDGDMILAGGVASPTFENCYTETDKAAAGCKFGVDPLFADETYYHPQSLAGSYKGGWFAGGAWSADEATSPTVDAVKAPAGDEPQPNGMRLNIGYDGGSETASKAVLGTEPVVDETKLMVYAYPDTEMTEDGVTLFADVASTGGGANPSVIAVWDTADKGMASADDWGHRIACGEHAPWDGVRTMITDEISGVIYFRFLATNEKGTAWTDPVRTFTVATPPELAYDTDASPLTHVYRTGARVHLSLVSDGGVGAKVSVFCAPTADQSAVTEFKAHYGESVFAGAISVDLTGLEPGVEYLFYAVAENFKDTVRLDAKTFTTVAADAKLTFRVDGLSETARGDGFSWAHATSLAEALAVAVDGDEIRVKAGLYELPGELALANISNLVIRGGYAGEGDARGGETVLSGGKDSAAMHRIFRVEGSSVLFDTLSFAYARNNDATGNNYGQAVGLYDCAALFTNCVFDTNGDRAFSTGNDGNNLVCGGAIGAKNGELTVVDCAFANNSVHGGGQNLTPLGGAVGATGARKVVVRGCTFGTNWVQMVHQRWGGGGALGFKSCQDVLVEDCRFAGNYARTAEGDSTYSNGDNKAGPWGGALYSYNSPIVVRNCSSVGDWNAVGHGGSYVNIELGGVFAFCGASTVASVSNVSILNAGETPYADSKSVAWYSTGSIAVSDATVAMTNVLHAGSGHGHIISQQGGTLEAVNCTFVGAQGRGVKLGCAYYQENASCVATFRNCIVWDNKDGFVGSDVAATLAVDHSDVQGGFEGEGNINADPKLYGPTKKRAYHLRAGSPCAGTGENRADMGCFPFDAPGLLLMVK